MPPLVSSAGFLRPAAPAGKAAFKELRKAQRLVVHEPPEQPAGQQAPAGPRAAGGATGAGAGGVDAPPAAAAGAEGGSCMPADISALYNGYAPLSIRLVEAALGPASWGPVAEVGPWLQWCTAGVHQDHQCLWALAAWRGYMAWRGLGACSAFGAYVGSYVGSEPPRPLVGLCAVDRCAARRTFGWVCALVALLDPVGYDCGAKGGPWRPGASIIASSCCC